MGGWASSTLRIVGRRVVLCSFGDPLPHESHRFGTQRRLVGGHFRLPLHWRDEFDQVAFVRLARHNGGLAAFASCEQRGKDVMAYRPLEFGGLMATLAVACKTGKI